MPMVCIWIYLFVATTALGVFAGRWEGLIATLFSLPIFLIMIYLADN